MLGGGRYRVEALLGRGGGGGVYRAYDSVKHAVVALKRLELRAGSATSASEPRAAARSASASASAARQQGTRRAQLTALFQREYQTLAQLVHPRIIEVYDYGVDEGGPFYTMELLDGEDLSKAGPLPWHRACEVLRDVASALTLLHSRRLLHRDISPRNVHYSPLGAAKLIDFGAMSPLGVSEFLVGTPQFVPPEALQRQALDARADLYSLGAVGYYLLTGRPPYAVRAFDELRDAYRTPPLPPVAYVPDLPQQLNALIMRLISLDRSARPTSAVDVVERMTAIAGLPHDPRLAVASSYLTTPSLAGRGKELAAVRRRALRALRGHGASLLVSGAAGSGLSRFLDACALEGKLAGALVLRGAPGAAMGAPHGVTRSLLRQLRAALSESECRQLVLPAELQTRLGRSSLPPRPSAPPPLSLQPGLTVQGDAPMSKALQDHVAWVAARRTIAVLIDDFNAIDPASAADVLALAGLTSSCRLILVVGSKPEPPAHVASALRVLAEQSRPLSLQPLTVQEIAAMLSSVFGAVPNVAVLAHRLHALSDGKPRLCMELAQHLVDARVIRYEAGGFVLPEALTPDDLPESLDEALRARCARLPREARAIGAVIALCAGAPLGVEQCLSLVGHPDQRLLERALQELVAAQMVVVQDEHVMLRQEAFAAALLSGLGASERRSLHVRVAELFAREPALRMRAAEHFFHGDEPARGVDVLTEAAMEGRIASQWFASFAELIAQALRACEQLGRPACQAFWLRRVRMYHALDYLEPGMRGELLAFAEELHRVSGLVHWQANAQLPDGERLTLALQLAVADYERTPVAQRICTPEEAIRELATFLASLSGYGCSTFDLELLEQLPSMAPYAALSPAIGLMDMIVCALRDLRASRHDHYVVGLRRALERIEQPDRAGLNDQQYLHARLGVLYGVALTGAALGDPRALEWAVELEALPSMRSAAWRVRQIAHLHRGDLGQAEACRQQVEVMLIQQASRQARAGTTLETEFNCYAHMDDLVNLRRLLPELRAMADDHAGWLPLSLLAQAELERIRGRLEPALQLNQQVLELARPGRHMFWSYAIGLQIRVLVELGRAAEAKQLGLESLALCEQHDMGALCNTVATQLAFAEAALGELESAIARVDRIIAHTERENIRGMFAGQAYEQRARLALLAHDEAGYARYYEACAAHYGDATESPFTLNLAHLRADALKAGLEAEDAALPRAATLLARAAAQRLRRELAGCADAQERAERALALVLETTGAIGGHLYGVQNGKVALLASAGPRGADDALARSVEQVVARVEQVNEEHTAIISMDDSLESGAQCQVHADLSYQLFPLTTPGVRERASGVIALHFNDHTRSEYTNEALAAIGYELSLRNELSLFTLAN